eukprot:596783_1
MTHHTLTSYERTHPNYYVEVLRIQVKYLHQSQFTRYAMSKWRYPNRFTKIKQQEVHQKPNDTRHLDPISKPQNQTAKHTEITLKEQQNSITHALAIQAIVSSYS